MPQPRLQKVLDKVAVLRATDLFGGLPDPVLQTIAGCAISRSLRSGEFLYSEREEATALYVVSRGELRSIRQDRHGREQVLSTERAGAILAAVAIFSDGKFYSTMIADTDADILRIEKRELHELCRKHTELLWNLARVMAHKLRHSAELIEALALRSVDERVAQHLLTVCELRGIQDVSACVVELKMNRTEIANRIGSVREVVSRAFTQLEKAGLIHVQGSRLVAIPDMQALKKFAGAEVPLKDTALASELSSDIA